jgi:hypothetical protein
MSIETGPTGITVEYCWAAVTDIRVGDRIKSATGWRTVQQIERNKGIVFHYSNGGSDRWPADEWIKAEQR